MALTNRQTGEKNTGPKYSTLVDDFTCETRRVNNNPLYSVAIALFINIRLQMHTDLFGIVGQRAEVANTEPGLSLS